MENLLRAQISKLIFSQKNFSEANEILQVILKTR